MICVHFNQKTDIEGVIYCGYCGEVRKANIKTRKEINMNYLDELAKMLGPTEADINRAMETLAKNPNIHPDGLKMAATVCYALEATAPPGSAFAYGCHQCGDKLSTAAAKLTNYLNQFGRP